MSEADSNEPLGAQSLYRNNVHVDCPLPLICLNQHRPRYEDDFWEFLAGILVPDFLPLTQV